MMVTSMCCYKLSIGVGDVCSFAEMNPRRNGHPDVSSPTLFIFPSILKINALFFQWQNPQLTSAKDGEHSEHGKVELSLIEFSVSHTSFLSACLLILPLPPYYL